MPCLADLQVQSEEEVGLTLDRASLRGFPRGRIWAVEFSSRSGLGWKKHQDQAFIPERFERLGINFGTGDDKQLQEIVIRWFQQIR
jgi:hypothetical protein